MTWAGDNKIQRTVNDVLFNREEKEKVLSMLWLQEIRDITRMPTWTDMLTVFIQ